MSATLRQNIFLSPVLTVLNSLKVFVIVAFLCLVLLGEHIWESDLELSSGQDVHDERLIESLPKITFFLHHFTH